MKVCSKCKEEKDESDFAKNKKMKCGYSSHCKACMSWYAREFRKKNEAIIRSLDKIKREKCKESMRLYSKKYRGNNKERERENQRKLRARYKENNESKMELGILLDGDLRCSSCKLIRKKSCFHIKISELSGFNKECKTCISIRVKKKRYNLNEEQLDYYLSAESCDICKTPKVFLKMSLCIDHNHKTDKVRGMLCSNCNSMIGMAKEDVNILKAGAAYLKKHEERTCQKKLCII